MTCEILLAAIGFIVGPLLIMAIFSCNQPRDTKDETTDLRDKG
jgi:hypothetical protein